MNKKVISISTPPVLHSFLQEVSEQKSMSISALFVEAIKSVYGLPSNLKNETDLSRFLKPKLTSSKPSKIDEDEDEDSTPQKATILATKIKPKFSPEKTVPATPSGKPKMTLEDCFDIDLIKSDEQYIGFFEKFGYGANVAQTIPFEEDSFAPETPGFFIITFRGILNPRAKIINGKTRHPYMEGIFDHDPVIKGKSGGFITTIISRDILGEEVIAGKCCPEHIIREFSEGPLEMQAKGSFDVMFNPAPMGTPPEVEELWGFCGIEALNELAEIFEEHACIRDIHEASYQIQFYMDSYDSKYPPKNRSDSSQKNGLDVKEFIEQIMIQHYSQWQDFLNKFDCSKQVAKWNRKSLGEIEE